jgi:hypothetical protein
MIQTEESVGHRGLQVAQGETVAADVVLPGRPVGSAMAPRL